MFPRMFWQQMEGTGNLPSPTDFPWLLTASVNIYYIRSLVLISINPGFIKCIQREQKRRDDLDGNVDGEKIPLLSADALLGKGYDTCDIYIEGEAKSAPSRRIWGFSVQHACAAALVGH